MNFGPFNFLVFNLTTTVTVAAPPLDLPATIVTLDPGGLVWTEIDPGRTVSVAADAFAALDPSHTIGA